MSKLYQVSNTPQEAAWKSTEQKKKFIVITMSIVPVSVIPVLSFVVILMIECPTEPILFHQYTDSH